MRQGSISLMLAVSMCLGLTAAAEAQDFSVPRDEISAQALVPAPGRGNYLMVDGAMVTSHLTPAFGLVLDYAHRPFVLHQAQCTDASATNCTVEGPEAVLSRYIATAYLTGAITLYNRVQLGLVLPLSLTNGDPFQFTRDGSPVVVAPGGSAFGIGDLRLSAKVRIIGEGEGVGVAAVVYGTIPFAHFTADSRFLGDQGPVLGGHVVGEFSRSRFHVSGNIGGFWRESGTFLSSQIGPRLTYGIAGAFDATPLVSILGEITGSSSFTAQIDENAAEWRLGARIAVGDFKFLLMGGTGLIQGLGVPVFRFTGGLQWAPDHDDRDGDGVEDRADSCPTEAEDLDGWDDRDGCPELDNDGDEFPDAQDQCADEAEDRDGFEDTDGCPDRDNDSDGVPDGFDSCPSVPEDRDEDRDEDGCPENDRDRDNIEDEHDQCPDEAEDTDGYGDEDGCPETDFDSDGVPDDSDECPDQPEDRDGVEDQDGCTEEAGPRATPARRRRGGAAAGGAAAPAPAAGGAAAPAPAAGGAAAPAPAAGGAR
ncbi:MAG: thrombospondin type 3 repeat-containing protein [Sandaracinaceae bacterium]|nr:thrombospondin type 3 repeat-containing protein [Sandaracinaceae bacterium]